MNTLWVRYTLWKLILNNSDITINEIERINNYFIDFLSNTSDINLVNEQPKFKNIQIQFKQLLDNEQNDPT